MRTSEDIRFNELSLIKQRDLLEELLMNQELKGKVLEETQEEITKKRLKKPCPHCSSERVHKRGKQKGVVATALQRDGQKYLKAVASNRLSKEEIAKVFAKDNPTIKHKALLAEDHVDKKDKSIHLQRVNNTHAQQVRNFLRPFNGVSSKYLQNYLNWYAYIDKLRNSGS